MTRRGFILVFVLGVTTVVTALGLSYIQSNNTVMQQASNRYAAVRAQYVAEAGATLAQHYLQYPPTTVAANSFYSGGSGIAIDSTFDTVDMRVTAGTIPRHYIITALATVRNAAGTEALARQKITSEVIIPPVPKWSLTQAVLANGDVAIQSGVTVAGDLHANGNASGPLLGGSCTGAVSATGLATWLAGGPPTSVKSGQAAVVCPPISPSLYQTYRIYRNDYVAYSSYTKNEMVLADAATLKTALDGSTNNPGRIVYLPLGDFTIRANVAFTGMLVVRGNLYLDSPNITLTAAANYPALLVTGNIQCKSTGQAVTITGPVLCGGMISDAGQNNCALTVYGAVLVAGGLSRTGSGSTLQFKWTSDGSTFWNLAKTANPDPVTNLEWVEN